MKSPFLFSLSTFLLLSSSVYSQLSIISIDSKNQPKTKGFVYDTLSNIQYLENINEYSKYIGQNIMFYPRFKGSKAEIQYYGNFKYKTPRVLSNIEPDTIWLKHRRKVRPTDYRIYFKVSDNYKADSIYKKKVCFGNDFLSRAYGSTLKSGLYTPANMIEGKTFKILDFQVVKVQEVTYLPSRNILSFSLLTEFGDTIFWTSELLISKDYSFPAIIVSFYEKMKRQYLNQTFFVNISNNNRKYFATNINKDGRFSEVTGEIKCVDLSLVGNNNEYYVPKLIFEDLKKNTLAIDITDYPSLRYIEGYDESINKEKCLLGTNSNRFANDSVPELSFLSYIATLNDLVDAQYVKEKLQEEKKLKIAEEINNKKVAQERNKRIINKYGSYYGKLILGGYVKTGMTKEMCTESWGAPSSINKTSGSFGVHEQWVYDSGSYLYFEDGILTTIQN